MKRTYLAALAAILSGSAAYAADLPAMKAPPAPAPAVSADGFDFAFGFKAMSDYVNRGVSQTNHLPGATAYGELRYNIGDTQLYAGTQLWVTHLPTDPFGELDLDAGVRQTWGKFTADVGGIYYLYPGNKNQYFTNGVSTFLNIPGANASTCVVGGFCATTARDPSYLELYFKPTYNVTDSLALGANFYFSPDWGNYHSFTSEYLSFTPKYTFGDSGFAVSGEIGYQWLGSLKPGTIYNSGPLPFKYPNYLSYNAGVSYTWKNITADLRYYGSGLNKSQCYVVSSDPAGNLVGGSASGRSGWCGDRIVGSIAFDLVASKDLKLLP